MKKIGLLFLILPIWASAQVIDDFSDGDFTTNPAWIGTDTSFSINALGQLQSAATAAGEAWLSTPLTDEASPLMEWRFWIREAFSPSPNNYADVWLCADVADLPMATQGYFLRFGSSGSQDAIELYRKDSSGEHLICQGKEEAIATSFKVAVKITREEGRWTLATDYDNMGNYEVEAEGFDDTGFMAGYFGFHLRFTSSNARKFYFDDVYVGPAIIDTEPPKLLSVEVDDAQHLLLVFNEPLDGSALDPWHYHVLLHDPSSVGELSNFGKGMSGSIEPDTVHFIDNTSRVRLCFNEPLPENTSLTLQVTEISDLSGNSLPLAERMFALYQVVPNDVVINEIMADPSPVVGLPEWEYVELFNTTDFPIDLKDWTFRIGNSGKTFPAIQLAPQGYLILCKAEAEPEFEAYGATCGFSSFSIANAGATLRLCAPDETLISEVSFNDRWYHDTDKKNGGWSLEQIDPFNPCAGALNWTASSDASGGTPGRVNAVNAPNEVPPEVARVNVSGDDEVLLWFDQQMNRESLTDPLQYAVEALDLHPFEVRYEPVENAPVELLFDYHFEEGVVYTLTLNGMESCTGKPIASDTQVPFAIPNDLSAGDVLINEILFDPVSPGVDYVELYNRSDKTFDLSELRLGVIKENFPSPVDTVLKEITPDSRLFLPHTYVLLSTDGYTVCQQYHGELGAALDMEAFPTLANSGGEALLTNREGLVIDQMPFSEKMHYPLLKETKGVALERVSWEAPSDQLDNWHSAAEAVGFGTPGYRNSMMAEAQSVQAIQPVHIVPAVFSPDGDGFDDCCSIHYQLDAPGYTMNAYVFSADGRLVRHLVKGELVAQEGGSVWNGLDHRGDRVPTGLYVVITEVFDLEGAVRRYKNAVAVVSR